MSRIASATVAVLGAGLLSATTALADPAVVEGPGYLPECFAPWSAETQYFQWEPREGPYRIALVNGFVGNTWRIQMIQTAKAFAEQPGIAENIAEFKIVSTGTDAAAQLGAIEDFINQGYDAIVTIAVSPTGFDRVIRLANRNNVVLVPFDNILDTTDVMMVNEDQLELGRLSGQWLVDHVGTSGKILEVRGLPGNSVDRDRHLGFREVMEADGNNFEIIEVVGNWADGDAQNATADAIAVHGQFDGVFTQGGSTGTVQAMIDAGHPFVPVAGEAENGFRKLIAQHAGDGLLGISIGQSPGLVAISMKAAISALQGNPMPQLISVPLPMADYETLEDGVNYWSDLGDNFFTPNEFPPCDVNITAPEIMAQTAEDVLE
ncbi:MAG: sugar ABC transporter substrate-binding protein [Alphaproteobacteria bacterium]